MPQLSVIVLTRNEEANVADCARSLLAENADLEVLVVDSASRDRTVAIARELEVESAGRVRVIASARDIPIGEARNLGIAESRAPAVAFVSADATVAPGWATAMLAALADADVAYGRQAHDPPAVTVAAIVRGLRYHHFRSDERLPPATYASNVNAAVRREVFERVRYVSDGPASALDDVLFTREAERLGYGVAYARDALVRHKDASTLAGELAKNKREGYGWGLLEPALGLHRAALAWGAALAVAILAGVLAPTAWTAAVLLAVLYAPAVRRFARAARPYLRHPLPLAGAVLVSPAFDLAFLGSYLRGLRRRRSDLTGVLRPTGA